MRYVNHGVHIFFIQNDGSILTLWKVVGDGSVTFVRRQRSSAAIRPYAPSYRERGGGPTKPSL